MMMIIIIIIIIIIGKLEADFIFLAQKVDSVCRRKQNLEFLVSYHIIVYYSIL